MSSIFDFQYTIRPCHLPGVSLTASRYVTGYLCFTTNGGSAIALLFFSGLGVRDREADCASGHKSYALLVGLQQVARVQVKAL